MEKVESKDKNQFLNWLFWFVPVGMLLIGIPTGLPYGYYTLLRLVLTICSGILCFCRTG